MSLDTSDWEAHLLSLAKPENTRTEKEQLNVDARQLDKAYKYCEAIIAHYSQAFFLATRLLPFEKRTAIRVLYAFCRIIDNIVDDPGDVPMDDLMQWQQSLIPSDFSKTNNVALAWADVRRRFQIPIKYPQQLIDGVACDLEKMRYETFSELAQYAYGVASTVGLMSMHVIGYSGEDAIPHAIKLGLALQITNILRDVGEDAQMGRIYLPQEELYAFSLSDEDILNGRVSDRWMKFMRFQIARNRQLYENAWDGIKLLHPDGQFAVAAAGRMYAAILKDIEDHDYDVFNRRAYVRSWRKLNLIPRIWLQTTFKL